MGPERMEQRPYRYARGKHFPSDRPRHLLGESVGWAVAGDVSRERSQVRHARHPEEPLLPRRYSRRGGGSEHRLRRIGWYLPAELGRDGAAEPDGLRRGRHDARVHEDPSGWSVHAWNERSVLLPRFDDRRPGQLRHVPGYDGHLSAGHGNELRRAPVATVRRVAGQLEAGAADW